MNNVTLDAMLKLVNGLDVVCCITYAEEEEAAALIDDCSHLDVKTLAAPNLRAVCRVNDLPAVLKRIQGTIEAETMEFYQLHHEDGDEPYQPLWFDRGWVINTAVSDVLATREIGFGVLGDDPNTGLILVTLQSIATK